MPSTILSTLSEHGFAEAKIGARTVMAKEISVDGINDRIIVMDARTGSVPTSETLDLICAIPAPEGVGTGRDLVLRTADARDVVALSLSLENLLMETVGIEIVEEDGFVDPDTGTFITNPFSDGHYWAGEADGRGDLVLSDPSAMFGNAYGEWRTRMVETDPEHSLSM